MDPLTSMGFWQTSSFWHGWGSSGEGEELDAEKFPEFESLHKDGLLLQQGIPIFENPWCQPSLISPDCYSIQLNSFTNSFRHLLKYMCLLCARSSCGHWGFSVNKLIVSYCHRRCGDKGGTPVPACMDHLSRTCPCRGEWRWSGEIETSTRITVAGLLGLVTMNVAYFLGRFGLKLEDWTRSLFWPFILSF